MEVKSVLSPHHSNTFPGNSHQRLSYHPGHISCAHLDLKFALSPHPFFITVFSRLHNPSKYCSYYSLSLVTYSKSFPYLPLPYLPCLSKIFLVKYLKNYSLVLMFVLFTSTWKCFCLPRLCPYCVSSTQYLSHNLYHYLMSKNGCNKGFLPISFGILHTIFYFRIWQSFPQLLNHRWVLQWPAPVVPAPREAEAGGSL